MADARPAKGSSPSEKAFRHMEPRITVTKQAARIPRKLKKDAIVEALWEVRFESAESTQVPELAVGSLAGHPSWKHFKRNRLPLSDVPAPVRQQDPSLRNQATLELRDAERSRVIKIGSNVFSYHVLIPYCGGDQFKLEINQAIDFVFQQLEGFKAIRFGLRYINALNAEDHMIKSVVDLNLRIELAREKLSPPLNLNYRHAHEAQYWSLVRIASPEFVTAPQNVAMNALVDVDVFTPPGFETTDTAVARDWVKTAHKYEKSDFFRLIPEQVLNHLVEEWST